MSVAGLRMGPGSALAACGGDGGRGGWLEEPGSQEGAVPGGKGEAGAVEAEGQPQGRQRELELTVYPALCILTALFVSPLSQTNANGGALRQQKRPLAPVCLLEAGSPRC